MSNLIFVYSEDAPHTIRVHNYNLKILSPFLGYRRFIRIR